MQPKLPEDRGYMGDRSRGASLGRYDRDVATNEDVRYIETAPKFYLQRIRLDRGGYDPGGAYWGIGQTLYWAATDNGTERYFRALNRASAKITLLQEFPGATFYR